MYDIHSHILPMIDDGARSPEEALEMGRIADQEGITHMIATPHFDVGDRDFSRKVRRAVAKQNEGFKEAGIKLRLYPGAEIFLQGDIFEKLERNELLTLNDSDYLLVEFSLGEIPYHVEESLYRIRLSGKIPVLAHPERYPEVQRNPGLVEKWVQQGNLMQINATSITGLQGKTVQKTAGRLLKDGLAHVIASDAHSPGRRAPRLINAREKVASWIGKDKAKIIFGNSEKIINNRSVDTPKPFQEPKRYRGIGRWVERIIG